MSNYTKFPEFDNYNKLNQEELSNKTETGSSLLAFKEISDEIAMSTPWGENSTFHSKFQEQQERERYLQKILSLMKKYCIEEFYYINQPINSSYNVFIYLKKEGEKLHSQLLKVEKKESKKNNSKAVENNRNISIPIIIRNSYFEIKSNENWVKVNNEKSYSLPFNQDYYLKNIKEGNVTDISSQELKQIYEDFIASESNMPECFDTNNYEDLVSKVQEQLSKAFYKNVNVAVNIKLLDVNGNLIDGKDKTLQTNSNKAFDVKLNITVKQDGTVEIKHIASENYMKQYVSKWQKEAKARGLEVDVEALRMQSIVVFESQETEKSFYQKFIQSAEALFNDKVAGYVEGVQVSQKIAANIWEQGTINQSTWLTKDKEHKEWPKYAQINPLVGGVTDGVVDEIVGIPLAVKGVYEIVTDDEKQEALKKIFTKEGAKQMLEGLATNAEETLKDNDKSQHFAGQTVVSVATMLSGAGFLTKAGKIDEALEVSSDLSNKILNPKAAKILDDLRKTERYNPDILKAIEGYLESIDPNILGKLADKTNFDLVLKEMSQQWKKFHGSKFLIKNIENRGDDFVTKINKFEARIIDEANFTADVQLSTGKYLEYKSWKKNTYSLLNGEQAQKQLKNYINSGDFEYVVDRQKLLSDGVSDPEKFVKEHFQKIFKENADTWFRLESSGGLIKSEETLMKLFNTKDFIKIKAIINDSSNNFYNKIIKVE